MTRLSTIIEKGRWFKGNTHTHSTLSDGDASPEQLVDRYRDLGYHFLAITDHRLYGVHESLNRSDFLLLPGVELDVFVSAAEAYCHHVVGLGIPGKNRFKQGEKIVYSDQATIADLVQLLRENGNICIYAHPNWSHAFPESLLDIPGLCAVEIYNNTCEVGHCAGFSEAWVDRLLYGQKRIFSVASDDTHKTTRDAGGGFISVKAKSFTQEAIIESLLSGSFFASEGPLIESFYIEDQKAYLTCSPCKRVGFLNDRRPRSAVNDPTGSLTEASIALEGSERYVRAVCIDQLGRKAWSQPIWL